MMDRIVRELLKIEKQHGVKIVYAVEAGSRAWGYESNNSDYDIRFIYVHPVRHYLSLQHTKDVIEVEVNNQMEFVGWDVKKALSLLHKSNPSILEWLTEENIYTEHRTVGEMKELAKRNLSSFKVLHHNLNMAKRNIHLYEEKNHLKQFLNVIRPFLSCLWVEQFQSFPPNHIDMILNEISIDKRAKEQIGEILLSKRKGIVELPSGHISSLITHINEEIMRIEVHLEGMGREQPGRIDEFNHVFLKILEEMWGIGGLRSQH